MKLRYAPRARVDIAYIHQYIARHNSAAATAIVRQIRANSSLAIRASGETDIPGVHVFPISLDVRARPW